MMWKYRVSGFHYSLKEFGTDRNNRVAQYIVVINCRLLKYRPCPVSLGCAPLGLALLELSSGLHAHFIGLPTHKLFFSKSVYAARVCSKLLPNCELRESHKLDCDLSVFKAQVQTPIRLQCS